MLTHLDFEKPIAELEDKIEELRHLSSDSEVNIEEEVARLLGKRAVAQISRAAECYLQPDNGV